MAIIKRKKAVVKKTTAVKTSRTAAAKKQSNAGMWWMFGIILVAAMCMRLYQPDWYNDRQFHPDERWIVSSAVPGLSYPGRPIGLQYGSLPLYILSVQKDAVNFFNNKGMIHNMNAAVIGGARAMSGLVDCGSIVMIFLTCLLLFNRRVALLSSLLLSFTVLNIHSSHFFTVDTFLTLFVTMTVYFSARIYKSGKLQDYILAGVCYAAALASKTSALPLAAVILAGHLFSFFSITGKTKADKSKRINLWINLCWAALVTCVAFFVFMPYAVLDYQRFIADQNYQKNILVTGQGDVPYNRQYLNTTPYLYFLNNLVQYTMGIPYGIAALFAFFFYIVMFFVNLRKGKIPDKEAALLLAWTVPYFLIVGTSFAKFNRYMLPMTPFLAVLVSKFIFDLYAKVKRTWLVTGLMTVVIAGAVFYGLAFMNIYVKSHTWIQSSEWMYSNIPSMKTDVKPPRMTRILNEMWGDDLPTYAKNGNPGMYQGLQWALQEPDSPWKYDELSSKLSQTDYVVMADRRAKGTYVRLPKKYPINYFYYTTMLSTPEKLGFKLVYDKAVYPSLFGITIKDDRSDESFQLYDHPHVHIFKNEAYLTQDQIKQVLAEGATQVTAKFGALEKGATNPNMGQFKDKVAPVMPYISIFLWYILIQVLAFIIWPVHFKVFGNLNDKGYGIAKVTGVFVFVWTNWMLVSLKVWNFYQINLWILFMAFAAASIWYYVKNTGKFAEFSRSNRRHILLTEIFFLAAYLFFIMIKLWSPDIHNVAGQGYNGGGEPMGMAYLSSIFNDVKFPPHDPWLSGFTLNYYYWGQLLLATISKLLGYFPRVTYNLSLSMIFALSFIAAYTFGYNMTGKYRYGILAGCMLALAGNFHTLEFIFNGLVNTTNLQQAWYNIMRFQFIWDPTRIYPTPAITEVPFFSWLYGDLHAHNIVIPFTIVAVALLYNFAIAENRTGKFIDSFGETNGTKTLSIFALALVLGSMLTINTWNFPPVAVLYAAAFFMMAAVLFVRSMAGKKKPAVTPAGVSTAIAVPLGITVLTAAASYLLFIPFHAAFQSPYAGGPHLISKPERATMYMMFKYFSVFFMIIFAYCFFVLFRGFEGFAKQTGIFKLKKLTAKKLMDHVTKVADRIFEEPATMVPFVTALSAVVVALALSLLVQPTFGPLFLMLTVVCWMLVTTENKNERFALLVTAVSLCIIWGTDIFFVADGRMNTVFKFYMVAWTFLALCTPYLLYVIVTAYGKLFKFERMPAIYSAAAAAAFLLVSFLLSFSDSRTGYKFFDVFFMLTVAFGGIALYVMKNRLGKYLFMGAFVFLLVPATLYPVMGSFIRMQTCSNNFTQKPRIDGLKYMENIDSRPGSDMDFDKFDYQAIDWINNHIDRIEPVVEAPGERMYTGVSRISIFTGMPTLVGWGYQEGQQSGRSQQVNERTADTANIYNTPDIATAMATLKKYDARYIYVGNIERLLYPVNIGKFSLLGGAVYRNDVSAIYKVDPDR